MDSAPLPLTPTTALAMPDEWFDILQHPATWTLAALLALLSGLGAWRAGLWVGFRRRRRLAAEGSRRALAGSVAEQWAPLAPGFPGHPADARFLGAPVDYVVFDGLADGDIREVILVEVKSGSGKLSRSERSLRDCVAAGRVRFLELRVPRPEDRR